MSNVLVIIRPDHDPTTNYISAWSKYIIEHARKKNIGVVDLRGNKANRRLFESIIVKTKPSLIVLNGHGDENTVAGYDNKPIVTVGVNERILKNTITYALSCQSGKKLGKKAVGAGAKAYIGYDDDFIFIIDENSISKPLNDKTAALFFEPSNAVAVSLLKGNTAGASSERSKQMFRKNIRQLLTSESPQQEKDALPYLAWNMNHQVCLGDQQARF